MARSVLRSPAVRSLARVPPLLAMCFGALILSDQSVRAEARTPVVLTVNGLAVPREEFLWFMNQERQMVIDAVAGGTAIAVDEDFWAREGRHGTPRQRLLERTVQRVTREKVEQLLFVDLGLIADANFSSFQADVERINRERAAASAAGRAVYGPTRFSQLQYFGYSKSRLRMQAKEILARDRLVASDEALQAYYHRHQWRYRSAARSSWEIVTFATAPEEDAVRRVLRRLRAGATAQQVKDEWGDAQGQVLVAEQLILVTDERLAETVALAERLAAMKSVKAGGAAILASGSSPVQNVGCTARTRGATRRFEDVRSQVLGHWLEERYEALVAERASGALVTIDQTELALVSVN